MNINGGNNMLNRIILIITLILCGGLAILASAHYQSQTIQTDLNQKILGKWVAEADSNVILEFLPESKLNSYYNGVIIAEDRWEFTDDCDGAILEEGDYGILKMASMDDASDYMCYVVMGMESVLTLLYIPGGNLHIYDRVVD